MKIAIIGAGYVGIPTAAVFATLGHAVALVEKDAKKVAALQRGQIPFFEPGLPGLIKKVIRAKKLTVGQNLAEGLKGTDVIFICVGTPPKPNGEADLTQVFAAAKEIGKALPQPCVIVMKSTVPVGTCEKVEKIITGETRIPFHMASSPEFLREGEALHDTKNPSRVVIGTANPQARKILTELHKRLSGERVFTDLRTAELIKYASNAFLATKISFINEIANVCEEVGANVEDVSLGMGLDPRIGPAFLKAGLGYGGSCFPKDTRALNAAALSHNYDFKLLKAVIEVNQLQRQRFVEKVSRALKGIKGKTIGVLGLSFKAHTDDVRESAALEIIERLMKKGARVKGYDPKAGKNAARVLKKMTICITAEEAAKNSDCLLILTEWPEFKNLPWGKMKKTVNRPLIIDGRNLLNLEIMKKLGFQYISIGRI